MRKINLIPPILIIIAIVFIVHNFMLCDVWFQFEDIHHETIVIALLASAFVIFAALKGWFAIFRVALRF